MNMRCPAINMPNTESVLWANGEPIGVDQARISGSAPATNAWPSANVTMSEP